MTNLYTKTGSIEHHGEGYVIDCYDGHNLFWDDESLAKIIENLQRVYNELIASGHTDIKTDLSANYEDGVSFEISAKRKSTEQELIEYQKYLQNMADKKALDKIHLEKQEKELYLKLKAKYGDQVI